MEKRKQFPIGFFSRWFVGGEEAVSCMGKEEWTVWVGCGGELAVNWCLGGGK